MLGGGRLLLFLCEEPGELVQFMQGLQILANSQRKSKIKGNIISSTARY